MRIIDGVRVTKDGTKFYLDGHETSERKYRKRYPAEGAPVCSKPWARAMKCQALKVHPGQREEAAAHAAALGVATDYDQNGFPEFRSRDHRNRFLKAKGLFDKDAGYGDATFTGKGLDAPDNYGREIPGADHDVIREIMAEGRKNCRY